MAEERSRFGVTNLLAAAALLGYGWFAAAYGPDGSFPGSDFGSLAYGLSRQGLWLVPVGILIPLVLPRARGVITGFFLVLLPSLAIGAVLTALVVAAPDAAPWRVLESFVVPDLAALLAPLTGMFVGVLFGAVVARGLGSALLLIPALIAIAAVLLASVAVLLLVLTDRVAVTDPIGPRDRRTGSTRMRSPTSIGRERPAPRRPWVPPPSRPVSDWRSRPLGWNPECGSMRRRPAIRCKSPGPFRFRFRYSANAS